MSDNIVDLAERRAKKRSAARRERWEDRVEDFAKWLMFAFVGACILFLLLLPIALLMHTP